MWNPNQSKTNKMLINNLYLLNLKIKLVYDYVDLDSQWYENGYGKFWLILYSPEV